MAGFEVINLAKEALSSEKKLNEVLAMKVDPMVKIELEVIVEEIRSLNQKVAKLEKTIADEGRKLEGHKNLTSIKGIGPLTGSILLSVIGDINDFADEGKLAAYFGIVPRVSKSNETNHSGRITKRGSKLGRTALVQCALIAHRSYITGEIDLAAVEGGGIGERARAEPANVVHRNHL
jgi:transposase